MKRLSYFFIILLTVISCNSYYKSSTQSTTTKHNAELLQLFKADQEDRKPGVNWRNRIQRDKVRKKRVLELLKANKVITSKDHYNAAIIFQHGGDTLSSSLAVKMMKRAIELDNTISKWLLAAAIDRDLLRRNKPQIYGTQYRKLNGKPWEIYNLDTTKITDKQRKAYGVKTLAEQKEKLKKLNQEKSQ